MLNTALDDRAELSSFYLVTVTPQLTCCANSSYMETNNMNTWRDRERERFNSGFYTRLPRSLWDKLDELGIMLELDHYIHRAIKTEDQTMIAYTQSESHGESDRQTSMRFGKYLKKYFPEMIDKRVQELTVLLRGSVFSESAGSEYTLQFATDRETINSIFETRMNACDSTYNSCMYGKFTDWDDRPYHVYADSPDVAVAYLSHWDDSIVARSVVSTKDKHFVRLYSVGGKESLCSQLCTMLKALGYSHDELTGSRLTMLPERNGAHVLPYLDNGGMSVKESGQYWVVSTSGIECNSTEGTVDDRPHCSTCENLEDECECCYCECCESRTRDGCDDCDICEFCDGCQSHDSCSCDRCSRCNEMIESHRGYSCCECECLSDKFELPLVAVTEEVHANE